MGNKSFGLADNSSHPMKSKNKSEVYQIRPNEGKQTRTITKITEIRDQYIQNESASIFGEVVQRVPISSMSKLPHKHIGAVVCRGPCNTLQTGTGMLISPDLVLTCAHVIMNNEYFAPYPRIFFYPGQYGEFKNCYEIEDFNIPEEYTDKKTGYKSYDYALLKLRKRIEDTEFIQLCSSVEGEEETTTFSIFGYPETKYEIQNDVFKEVKQYGLTKDKEYVLDLLEEAGYIIHRISTEKGQSGAPVIKTDEKGKLAAIGIHVGSSEEYSQKYQLEFPQLTRVNLTKLTSVPVINRLKKFAKELNGQPFQIYSAQHEKIKQLQNEIKKYKENQNKLKLEEQRKKKEEEQRKNNQKKIKDLQMQLQKSKNINQAKNLDEQQYSNYTPKQAIAFMDKFKCTDIYDSYQMSFSQWRDDLQSGKFSKQQYFRLQYVNFTSFPLFPPTENLQKIIIRHSQISVLDVRLNTPDLQELRVCSCKIEKIVTIRGCPNLTSLSLNRNRLREIEGLNMLPKLQQLNVCYNKLAKISNINHLKDIQRLFLSKNMISAIQELSDYHSLQNLDLNNNRITHLNEHFLQLPPSLKQVNLVDNLIRGGQSDRDILRKFKDKRPKVRVYFGGGKSGEEFSEVYEAGKHFKDGHYRIVPCNNPDRALEFGVNKYDKDETVMCLGEVRKGEAMQRWSLRLMEDDEYCIFSADQKIVKVDYKGQCLLQPYEKQKHDENLEYRRLFEKAPQTSSQQQTYRIRGGYYKQIMTVDKEGQVVMAGKMNDGSQLWRIIPFE